MYYSFFTFAIRNLARSIIVFLSSSLFSALNTLKYSLIYTYDIFDKLPPFKDISNNVGQACTSGLRKFVVACFAFSRIPLPEMLSSYFVLSATLAFTDPFSRALFVNWCSFENYPISECLSSMVYQFFHYLFPQVLNTDGILNKKVINAQAV